MLSGPDRPMVVLCGSGVTGRVSLSAHPATTLAPSRGEAEGIIISFVSSVCVDFVSTVVCARAPQSVSRERESRSVISLYTEAARDRERHAVQCRSPSVRCALAPFSLRLASPVCKSKYKIVKPLTIESL